MEPVAGLLKALADKLGTTAEYLWAVLIRQAPIDASIQLGQMVILGVVTYCLTRLHCRFLRNGTYQEMEEGAGLPMFIAALVLAVAWIAMFVTSGDVINGYFNPEYWAFEKVMHAIRK